MPPASLWEEAELLTGTTRTGEEEGPDSSCNRGSRGQEVPGAASRGEEMPGHHSWYTVCKGAILPPPHSTPGGFHTLPGVGNPDSMSTGGRTTVADWASRLGRAGGLLIPSPDGNDGDRSDGDSQLRARTH